MVPVGRGSQTSSCSSRGGKGRAVQPWIPAWMCISIIENYGALWSFPKMGYPQIIEVMNWTILVLKPLILGIHHLEEPVLAVILIYENPFHGDLVHR